MNPADRLKIQTSLDDLIQIDNLEALFEEVIRRGISFPDMIERLKVGNESEEVMKKRFFKHVQTRGPSAFHELVQALFATGNRNQALMLDPVAVHEIHTVPGPLSNSPTDSAHHTLIIPSGASLSDVLDDDSKLPIKINVKKAILYNNGNLPRSYQMMSTPRGFALIINITDFEGDYEDVHKKKRLGAEHDAANLQTLLEALSYRVTVETNVHKENLLKHGGILDKFIAQFSRENVDSCFVCIMSHGDEDFWIEMSDAPSSADYASNKIHLWNDVINRFSNRNFPRFIGKPKIFVIQACRGLKQNIGMKVKGLERRTQSDSSRYQFPTRVVRTTPEFNHIMLLNSTLPGFESIRDKYRGSWFIECLCNVLMNHAWHMSLAEMSSLVAEELEQLETVSGVKQSSEFTGVGTVYNLFFNPGLAAESVNESETQSRTVIGQK